jgi:hypothetical protein
MIEPFPEFEGKDLFGEADGVKVVAVAHGGYVGRFYCGRFPDRIKIGIRDVITAFRTALDVPLCIELAIGGFDGIFADAVLLGNFSNRGEFAPDGKSGRDVVFECFIELEMERNIRSSIEEIHKLTSLFLNILSLV